MVAASRAIQLPTGNCPGRNLRCRRLQRLDLLHDAGGINTNVNEDTQINRIQPPESEMYIARRLLETIKTRLVATFRIRKFPPGGSLAGVLLFKEAETRT